MKNIKISLFFLFILFHESISFQSTNLPSGSNLKTYIKGMMFTSAVGVSCEVVFTAVYNYFHKKDKRLKGNSYIWMLPVYASIYPVYRIFNPIFSNLNTFFKYFIYVSMIYAAEYTSGKILRKLIGSAPWEKYYRGKKYAVDELIRLDYAPAWLLGILIFEKTCHMSDHY